MSKSGWQIFYEDAWRYRGDIMRRLIAEGETDARRIVGRFLSYERRHPVAADAQNKVEEIGYNTVNWFGFPNLPSGVPAFKALRVKENHTIVPFYDHPMDFVVDLLDGRAVSAVVELGCGFGRNLIELYYRGGPRVPYYGGEFTESGVAITAELGRHAAGMTLKAFPFDHTKPDLIAVPERDDVVIYTHHSIEQVRHIPADYFRTLAAHGRRILGIHFEPFGFQIADDPDGGLKPGSLMQKTFILQKGWNTNFMKVIADARDHGEIDLTFVAKDIFGGDYASPTSIAIWQSKPETS